MSTFPTATEVAATIQLAAAVVEINSDTEPAAFAGRREYLVDTSGGDVELTLPSVLGTPNGAELVAVKIDAANTLTITPAAAETINGLTGSQTIATQYAAMRLQRTTSGWIVANQ